MYRGRILGESRSVHGHVVPLAMSARERLRKRLMIGEPTHAICHPMQPERSSSASFVQTPNQSIQHPKHDMPISNQNSWETALFATHSSFAVLDLGASKTVIGADHVQGLIEGLDPAIRKNLSHCECDVTFRLGIRDHYPAKWLL